MQTCLRTLNRLVYAELSENENARKSDIALIIGVFKRQGIDTRKSFEALAADGDLRQMESITRARRKVQSEHPELRDAETVDLRTEREEVFKEYAHTKT
jgi:hypothetical protein